MYTSIIKQIEDKKNVLFHGPGGTGKTYTIRKLCKTFKNIRNIDVMAPTGKAAVVLELGAKTIHRTFGIKPLEQNIPIKELEQMAIKCSKYKPKFDLLIMDEISMVGSQLLTLVDLILKNIHNNNLPMGGVQVIFSGDFYQLPPVKDKWCFKADVWNLLDLQVIEFNIPKRYEDTYTFELLCRIRKNTLNPSDWEFLEQRKLAFENKEYKLLSVEPVILYATNQKVDHYNQKKLKKLPEKEHKFTSIDKFLPKNKCFVSNSVFEDLAPKIVSIKIGAKIMFTKNIDPDSCLVNGMMGVVEDINGNFVNIKIENGTNHTVSPCEFTYETKEFVYSRIQYPFKLSWAMTINKSQGSTLSAAIVQIDQIHNSGQVYVALSRVKNLSNLFINGDVVKSLIRATSDLPENLS